MVGSLDPRLKIRHLQCLVSLANHRSVQKTADSLSQTPSAVSKSLTELEEIVGAPLFIRKRTGLELTSIGESFLSYTRRAFSALHEGFDVMEHGANINEQINVGVLPTAASTLLPKAILSLQAEYPQVVVRIHAGLNKELLKRLKLRELHFVVGRLADPAEMYDVTFEHIYTEPLVLAVRSGHPLATVNPTAANIAGFPFILPLEGSVLRPTVETFLISSGIGIPKHRTETLSDAVARHLMQKSDAVWFTPHGIIAPDLETKSTALLQIDTSSTSSSVGISTLSEVQLSRINKLLIDRIRRLAATQRDEQQAPQ